MWAPLIRPAEIPGLQKNRGPMLLTIIYCRARIYAVYFYLVFYKLKFIKKVDELEEIYIKNEYRPLLELAEEERSLAVDLLNDVKEKFGGGETTGRCHTNREEKSFNHRLMPANKENFDFSPVSVTDIDIDGNPIEKIDNSHIYDNNLYDSESESDSYPAEYEEEYEDEDEENYFEPALVAPEENEEIRPEEIIVNDVYGFEITQEECPNNKVNKITFLQSSQKPFVTYNLG